MMMRLLLIVPALALAACATEKEPPVLVMTTDAGVIEIEMAVMEAPLSAANFLRLADGGHLDGAGFYRVVRPENDNGEPVISVVQGGIQDAPQPFPPIPHESTDQTGLRHIDGAISMARLEPGSASTEFFICIGDQPALDFGGERNADGQGFAVFGRVVAGMEVVRAIHATPADQLGGSAYVAGQILADPVRITSVSIQ
ncbi:MAG: peptidylprolyl isomerase [Pseudomonadota bacterium]